MKAKVKNSSTKKIIWKSSKKKVATVSKNGVVTAKGKGKTTITATISGTNIKAKCKVTVKKYVTMTVRTTGYCNCSSCAGQWAGSATASGKMPRANHTIAVDKNLIKLGTKVQIGNIMYVAEDTGGAIKGKRIDIYYSSHSKAMAHGVKYQKIKVYI
ncbi:MAG: 3D domain-containing protein [Clostridiales bacterium]|nr:3D domain-containing protein [Clostridiales bacterium]